jgi:hypothetical protein
MEAHVTTFHSVFLKKKKDTSVLVNGCEAKGINREGSHHHYRQRSLAQSNLQDQFVLGWRQLLQHIILYTSDATMRFC